MDTESFQNYVVRLAIFKLSPSGVSYLYPCLPFI